MMVGNWVIIKVRIRKKKIKCGSSTTIGVAPVKHQVMLKDCAS